MADEYSINAKITADTSKFNRGVKNAQTSLKGFSKGLSDTINSLGKNGLVGSLANVSLAGAGLATVFNSVIKITKNIGKAINEVTNAYKGQLMAERALDTAIQNNPYMTGESSRALKEFASDIQRVSNYGDEELLPLIANLTSLGRTQEEIMQIVSVATDMASTGTMSLDTAITQLNATLNGNLGRLGQQNAELKDLTEEELRQGKAVEILGEKFKGLSQATVDTSKQLQNLKGDFKEALGEFTLPASDMWNKFWAGFYEQGIVAINRLNDSLQIKADYKATKEYIDKTSEWMRKYRPEERAGKWAEIATGLDETNLRAMTQALQTQLQKQGALKKFELEFLNALENEILLRREIEIETEKTAKRTEETTEEEDKIAKLKEEYLAKIEAQKKEWENIKAITGEEVSTEEKIKFYQDQLLAIMRDSGGQITTNNQYFKDQMAIIKDLENSLPAPTENVEEEVAVNLEWQKKLLEQKIELLQLEKAERIAIAIETGENVEAIEEEYNEKILDAKIERIEIERREALASIGDEENKAERIAEINQYYDNEVIKAKKETKDKKKKVNNEEEEDEKNKFAVMLGYAKAFAKDVAKVMKNIVNIASKILKGGFNILQKLVEFNIDEALNSVLEFEDKILTFFLETLPRMPSFFTSVIQSILSMLTDLTKIIKADDVANIIMNIVSAIGNALPQIIDYTLDVVIKVLNGVIDGLVNWLGSGGIETILDLLIKIQKAVENFVVENLEKIVDLFADHIDDFGDFLAESMSSASKTLPKLIKILNKIIITLIKGLARVFKNQEFIDTMIKAIEDITQEVLQVTPAIISAFVEFVSALIEAIVPKLPELIMFIIKAIIEAIPSIFGSIVSGLGKIIGSIFKAIFTPEFWVGLLQGFGEALGSIIQSVFQGGGYGNNSTGSFLGDLAIDALVPFGFVRHFFADGTNNAPKGLAMVGEEGPELVRFSGGEQVLNAHNTQKALAGAGGSSNTFNVNFTNVKDTSAYALVSQLKQYNRQMAINGIL